MARHLSYDQDKVKELRMSVIEAALEVMKGEGVESKWSQYKRDLVLKMSPRVIPQLNEVSGPDGTPIPISNVFVKE